MYIMHMNVRMSECMYALIIKCTHYRPIYMCV